MMSSVKNAMFTFSAGLLCLGLCFSSRTSAQVTREQFTGELNIKFQSGEEKKLERGVSILNEAEALKDKAEKEYAALTPVEIKERVSDALSKCIEAPV